MENISKFFGIFKNKAVEHIQNRMVICDAVKTIAGQDITPENITIKNHVIQIKGSQGLKNEIFIKKNALMSFINKRAPNFKVVDIK